MRAVLRLGYDALMTDIDVVWLHNPRPYLYCSGEPLVTKVDCTSMGFADIAVSSDNLSPQTDWKAGAVYPTWGTFNTGVQYYSYTPPALRLVSLLLLR